MERVGGKGSSYFRNYFIVFGIFMEFGFMGSFIFVEFLISYLVFLGFIFKRDDSSDVEVLREFGIRFY